MKQLPTSISGNLLKCLAGSSVGTPLPGISPALVLKMRVATEPHSSEQMSFGGQFTNRLLKGFRVVGGGGFPAHLLLYRCAESTSGPVQ
jgi:hypothetical protein